MTLAWAPGGDFGSPTYSLPIRVVDSTKSTFTDERRRRWKEGVDLALSRWRLPFVLEAKAESKQAYIATDASVSTLSVNPLVIANAIALVHLHSQIAQDSAGWIAQMSGGICLFTPWRGWWSPFPASQVASVIAHEIGHALGFGHGGTGVMSGRDRPNDEERSLAKAYYHA